MRVALLGVQSTEADLLRQSIGSFNISFEIIPCGDLAATDWLSFQIVILRGLISEPTQTQSTENLLSRSFLSASRTPYRVVYGEGQEWIQNALFCIAEKAKENLQAFERPAPIVRWLGTCESCGDADCEHRLFTKLTE